jgi:hypothetical protein
LEFYPLTFVADASIFLSGSKALERGGQHGTARDSFR